MTRGAFRLGERLRLAPLYPGAGRLLLSAALGAASVLGFAPFYLFPVPVLIPSTMRLAGILPIVVGIALNLAADRQFKWHGTNSEAIPKIERADNRRRLPMEPQSDVSWNGSDCCGSRRA